MSTDETNAQTPPADASDASGQTSAASTAATETGATDQGTSDDAGGTAAPAEAASAEQPAAAEQATAPVVEAAADAGADASAGAESTGDAEGASDPAEAVSGDEAPAGDASATGEAPKKKRRRRRRKKKPEGAEGATAEGAEGEGVDAAATPAAEGEEGTEKKKKRKKKPAAPPVKPAFNLGEEVFGRVAKVTDDTVWIDIAGKATGLFDRRDLLVEEPPAEGDQFIAVVASYGERGGMLMLARGPIDADQSKGLIQGAMAANEAMDGFVTGAVKGGIEVDLMGVRAFAPASHVTLRPGEDLSPLVGRRMPFRIVQYENAGRDIVVSRKEMLEQEAAAVRAEALKKVEVGKVVKGIVRTVVGWGVFVAIPEADSIEGLVHLSEAAHERGQKLTDLFKPGQEIEVKVLKIDEKGKLWLSRKQAVPDPWDELAEKFAVGTLHTGKVVRLQPFGAFVQLEPGLDGLIHTADLSMKQIAHPSDVVTQDESIEVVIASFDKGGRRIGLHPALPEDERSEAKQKVAKDRTVSVKIVQAIEGGLIARVLGVTGRMGRAFIPAGHTGTPRGTDLRKTFPVGTKLDAKVLDVDPRRGDARLSIRALKEDVERKAYKEYRAGVAKEASFGTFGDLLKKR